MQMDEWWCSYQWVWNHSCQYSWCLCPQLQASGRHHFCPQLPWQQPVWDSWYNELITWLLERHWCQKVLVLTIEVQFMATGWFPSSAITLYNNGGWLWRTCCCDFWTMFWWQASMSPHLVVFHYHYLWVIYCKSKDTKSLCPFAVVRCDVGKSLWQKNCCTRNRHMAWRLDASNNQPVAGICWCHPSEGLEQVHIQAFLFPIWANRDRKLCKPFLAVFQLADDKNNAHGHCVPHGALSHWAPSAYYCTFEKEDIFAYQIP